MRTKELKEDMYIIEWLDNLTPTLNTEKNYLQGMQAYTEFTRMTPQELIEESEAELGIHMRHRKIKKYLIAFRKHLQDLGQADYTVKAKITGVRSFYDSFEIDLPKIQGERRRARTIEENNQIPSKEDIQDVLRICDPLERAIILTGLSSGLSSNEIRNLIVLDFKAGYDEETGITTLDLRRGKAGVDFITFLSPEASRAIIEYLDYRGREAKSITERAKQHLEKQRIIDDSGYLFISRQIDDEFLRTRNEELRQLTENALQKMYRAISVKSRKSTSKGVYNSIRSHNMRKYFNSALLNAGADSFFVEFLMGHTLDDTRAAYFRASPEKLREIYKKYIPYLIVQKDLDIAESQEFQKLKSENEILAREAVRATVERSEIQKLRDEIEKIKGLTDGSTELLQLLRGNPEAIEIMKKLKK
ncbi:MAG: hypothetical protein QG646_1302 [Euryarchaeota archaeon]|nr:hypothetical protein [Euryarchaeota archaeon]